MFAKKSASGGETHTRTGYAMLTIWNVNPMQPAEVRFVSLSSGPTPDLKNKVFNKMKKSLGSWFNPEEDKASDRIDVGTNSNLQVPAVLAYFDEFGYHLTSMSTTRETAELGAIYTFIFAGSD